MDIPQPPDDLEQKNIIDKLANFVARNGMEFEEMTKQKQKDNPKFSFLYGGAYYNYYQYKVNSSQGQISEDPRPSGGMQSTHIGGIHTNTANIPPPPSDWSGPPPLMQLQVQPPQAPPPPPSSQSNQQPPQQIQQQQIQQQMQQQSMQQPQSMQQQPQLSANDPIEQAKSHAEDQIKQSEVNLTAQYQSLIQQQQIQIDEEIAKARTEKMNTLAQSCEISIEELNSVTAPIISSCTKEAISNGKNWIFSHSLSPSHCDCISQYLLNSVLAKNAAFTVRLHLIYLINDVLHHCMRKNADDLRKSIEKVVVPIYCTAFQAGEPDKKDKLGKLLNLWGQNNYFESSVIEAMQSPLNGLQNYQNLQLKEYPDIVTNVTNQVNKQYTSLQNQHKEFVAHINNQLQNKIQEQQQQQQMQQQQQQQPIHGLINPMNQQMNSQSQSGGFQQPNFNNQQQQFNSQPSQQPDYDSGLSNKPRSERRSRFDSTCGPNYESRFDSGPPSSGLGFNNSMPQNIGGPALPNIGAGGGGPPNMGAGGGPPNMSGVHNMGGLMGGAGPQQNMGPPPSLMQNQMQANMGAIQMGARFPHGGPPPRGMPNQPGDGPPFDFHGPIGPNNRMPMVPDLSRPPPGFPGGPPMRGPMNQPGMGPRLPPMPPVDDLMPSVPYYELPAGLMAPLVKLEDSGYDPIDPKLMRLPPPQPPSERLLLAVEAFYSMPSHERPRDGDGWEKLGLLEFFKAKDKAIKMREERRSGRSQRSPPSRRSPPPRRSPDRSPYPYRRSSRSRSRSHSPQRRPRGRRSRSPPGQRRSRSRSLTPRRSRSRSPAYRSRSRSPARRRRRSRSNSPSSYQQEPFYMVNADSRLGEENKGHQLLKKMGWGGAGLGSDEQGRHDPVESADARDNVDKYKGVGINMRDPFEQFRKNKSHGFIQRMRARGEEKA